MTEKLRAQLDQIDQWLIEPGGEDLAKVLSTIRGPDDEQQFAKDSCTNPIRKVAFPRTFASAMPSICQKGQWVEQRFNCWYVVGTREFELMAARNSGTHYEAHISWAAEVLGMIGQSK